jgi:hypothetical protein
VQYKSKYFVAQISLYQDQYWGKDQIELGIYSGDGGIIPFANPTNCEK